MSCRALKNNAHSIWRRIRTEDFTEPAVARLLTFPCTLHLMKRIDFAHNISQVDIIEEFEDLWKGSEEAGGQSRGGEGNRGRGT